MKRCYTIIILTAGVLITMQTGWGQELTGRQIAEKVYSRDDGKDSAFTFNMVLTDKRGKDRSRTLRILSKDCGELVNTFIEFTAPADIEGTRFLTLENKGEDDTQHLYLPALGRSRRIVGGQKKQSFVNTDYTYEDMERRHPDEDTHARKKDEKVGTWDCYVVESTPKNRESQYTRTVIWIDKKTSVIVKTDFFDEKNRHIKQFTAVRVEQKDGIWTQMETLMVNLKRETKTRMTAAEVKYNQGLDDKMFTVRRLEEK